MYPLKIFKEDLQVLMFFVISGFLITSIIIKENENGTFSLKSFWVRRIKRIIPALTVVTFSILIFKFWFLFRADIDSTGYQSISTLFSYANIYLWKLTRNYWGIQPEDTMFLHTWSLSVEEQFYIAYPILTVLILKKYKTYFRHSCIVLCLIGFLLFAYHSEEKPQASFYLLPFRFWELLVGCTVASFQTSYSRQQFVINHYHFLFSWIGLFLVVLSFFLIDSKNGVGVSLIMPTIGTALIIISTNGSYNFLNRILSNYFITFIGKISYSIYLWHWPLIYYLEFLDLNSYILYTFILFFISYISYIFIEVPARNKPNSLSIIIIFFTSCVIFSTFMINNRVVYDTSSFNKTVWSGFLYDSSTSDEKVDYGDQFNTRMNGIYIPEQLHKTSNISFSSNNDHTLVQEHDILVIGDSHALMWSPVIDQIAIDNNLTTIFKGTDGRFKFLEDFSRNFYNTEDNYTNENVINPFLSNKVLVFIITRWDNYPNGNSDIEDLVRYIDQIGSKSILIEQPPVLFFGDKNAPKYLSFLGHHPPIKTKVYIKHIEKKYGLMEIISPKGYRKPTVTVTSFEHHLHYSTQKMKR